MTSTIARFASFLSVLIAPVAAQSPAPGLRLWGELRSTNTHLVDTNGTIVHTWPSAHRPGVAAYLQDDGLLIRSVATSGLTIPGAGGGVQRVALDGTVVWDYRYQGPGGVAHHDIEVLPNGNVLLIAWEERTHAEAIAAGLDPDLLDPLSPFRPDKIIEVEQTGPTSGRVVWEWRVWDHLVQEFDETKANYGVVTDHPELVDLNYPPVAQVFGDWNHMNSVDYDPLHDWVILSPRTQDEIWIIDHSTTTAEASGHTGGQWGRGGDLLWRWGNPAAYGRGSAQDQQLFGQHSAVFIPDGYPGHPNIMVFNNRVPGGSQVWELELPFTDAGGFTLRPNGTYGPEGPVWSYGAQGFLSTFVSNVERLPNGNTLVGAGAQSWMFEVSPTGQLVWSHQTGDLFFHAHYVERHLWSDASSLSISAGGTRTFELIAGSEHAGEAYLLLGSASGISPALDLGGGILLPLIVDGWFMTTASFANVYPFGNSTGFLDALGRATATLSMPPAILPPAAAGLRLDHAFVAIAPNGDGSLASNAVPLTFVP